jgi:hypothetical protein
MATISAASATAAYGPGEAGIEHRSGPVCAAAGVRRAGYPLSGLPAARRAGLRGAPVCAAAGVLGRFRQAGYAPLRSPACRLGAPARIPGNWSSQLSTVSS